MAIYTSLGSQVEIVKNYGEVKKKNYVFHPIEVQLEDGYILTYDAYNLRADKGILEIEKNLNRIPITKVNSVTMKNILKKI